MPNPTWVEKNGLILPSGAMSNANTPPQIDQAMARQGMNPATPFSPGRPINPYAGFSIEPRQFDFRTGQNISIRPRQGRISFEMLRDLTTVYDVAEMCISHRIDSIRSFDWSIIPAMEVSGDMAAAVNAGRAAIAHPDGVTPYSSWIAKYLEDLLRYDAGTLFRRRNRGGQVIALEVLDGTTIAPILDDYGRTPRSPAPAYIQFANGLVWDWLTDKDIIYLPYRPQPNSEYGKAPMESIILTANTDIRLMQHLLEYWAEGSIPGAVAEAPPDQSDPAQVEELQQAWNTWVEGDQAQKVKVRWMPSGSKFQQLRDGKFDEPLALWLFKKTCAAFSVTPQDLGMTLDVNRASGETQMDIQERIADRPLALHIEGILSRYLQDDLGLPVRFKISLAAEKEDRVSEAQAWKIYTDSGAASIDEFRSTVLGLPVDNERPVPRFIMDPRVGPIPLDSLFAIAGVIDPKTLAPVDDVQLPDQPYDGTPGLLPTKLPGGTTFKKAPLNPDDPQFPESEHEVPGSGTVNPKAPVQASLVRKDQGMGTRVGGLVVRAADTGRVLMIQRSLDEDDPAAGTWEFPGGHMDGNESPWEAAWREWQEETGCAVPDGEPCGTWTVGLYQGFIWEIPSESDLPINLSGGRILNPDDPDGDCIETCSWWNPLEAQANPALRAECASADWSLIGNIFPAMKELTSGITADTGITGVILEDDEFEEDETDPRTVIKGLRSWRDNSRNRIKRGLTPRQNSLATIPNDTANALWEVLKSATTREEVDSIFESVIKSGDVGPKALPKNDLPGNVLARKIEEHYIPLIQQAVLDSISGLEKGAESYAASIPVVKAGNPIAIARAAARGALETNVVLDPAKLQKILSALYADSYLAGAHTAGSSGEVLASYESIDAGINWDSWTPGYPDAALQAADGGLSDLLASVNITIKGFTQSTTDQLGTILADSLAKGDPVRVAAKAMRDSLEVNSSRATMIARTETNRAMSTATLNTYKQNGVQGKEWLVSDPCDICQGNEDAGTIAVGDSFPSGDNNPPAHPNCLCSLSPVYHFEG